MNAVHRSGMAQEKKTYKVLYKDNSNALYVNYLYTLPSPLVLVAQELLLSFYPHVSQHPVSLHFRR